MQTKITAIVRDTKNPSFKTARITSVQLIPYIGKKIEFAPKVIDDA